MDIGICAQPGFSFLLFGTGVPLRSSLDISPSDNADNVGPLLSISDLPLSACFVGSAIARRYAQRTSGMRGRGRSKAYEMRKPGECAYSASAFRRNRLRIMPVAEVGCEKEMLHSQRSENDRVGSVQFPLSLFHALIGRPKSLHIQRSDFQAETCKSRAGCPPPFLPRHE
jgi:hypothetical protein